MIWLAVWCVAGAAVGSVVGSFSGRPGVGAVLGAFAGPLGWLMLLGAAPKAGSERSPSEVPASTANEGREEDSQTLDACALQPISWAASA
jgi:uncharacterized membrane protein YfcA